MTKFNKTQVIKNIAERTILITREFVAPVQQVWRAHSESTLLDQWWGPSPWRAETKTMDFRAGGYWHYAMVGPAGERHWARMNYLAIDPLRSIKLEDLFCDEHGDFDANLPATRGQMDFTATPGGTRVEMRMTYASEADLQTIVEMGFEQGITACIEQLALILERSRE